MISAAQFVKQIVLARKYTTKTFLTKRSKVLRQQILELKKSKIIERKQKTPDGASPIQEAFLEIRNGVKLDGDRIDRIGRQLEAIKGRDWVDLMKRDRCVRGAAELAATSLAKLDARNQEPSFVRQFLVMALSRRLVDWKSCSGIVHILLQDYINQNHSTERILSLAKRLYETNDKNQMLSPSSNTLILLINLSKATGSSEMFHSTWNSIVKVALQRMSMKDLPVRVTSAYLMGCLHYDGDDDCFLLFQKEGHSSFAIKELNEMTRNGLEGPLLLKDDIVRLIKKSRTQDSVLFLLDSRLGTHRYNKRQKNDEFLTMSAPQTPLEILCSGTPSKGPRRLGASLARASMLKLSQFNAFQPLMEIFASNVSPATLNTLIQIGKEKQSFQLASSALEIISDRRMNVTQRSYRRILQCLINGHSSLNRHPLEVLKFADYYMDPTSISNLRSIFEAMCRTCSNLDEMSVIFETLEKLLSPQFEPEGGLSANYPFHTSRHYRSLVGPIEKRFHNKLGIDEMWRLRVLVVAGKGASFLRCSTMEKLHFVKRWLHFLMKWKCDFGTESWTPKLEDRIFSILISMLINSPHPVEDLKNGFLYEVMKLGYTSGLTPGTKTKRTIHALVLHKKHHPPFKYFKHSEFPQTPLLRQITRGSYDLTGSNLSFLSLKLSAMVIDYYMNELTEIGYLKQ